MASLLYGNMKETIDRSSIENGINKSGCGHLPQSRQEVPFFGEAYPNDRVDERIQEDIDDYNNEYLTQEIEKIVWKGSDSIKDTNLLTPPTNLTSENTRPHKTS